MKKMNYKKWIEENIDKLKEEYEKYSDANFVMFCMNKFDNIKDEKN